jgi:hypothetical protein
VWDSVRRGRRSLSTSDTVARRHTSILKTNAGAPRDATTPTARQSRSRSERRPRVGLCPAGPAQSVHDRHCRQTSHFDPENKCWGPARRHDADGSAEQITIGTETRVGLCPAGPAQAVHDRHCRQTSHFDPENKCWGPARRHDADGSAEQITIGTETPCGTLSGGAGAGCPRSTFSPEVGSRSENKDRNSAASAPELHA